MKVVAIWEDQILNMLTIITYLKVYIIHYLFNIRNVQIN